VNIFRCWFRAPIDCPSIGRTAESAQASRSGNSSEVRGKRRKSSDRDKSRSTCRTRGTYRVVTYRSPTGSNTGLSG
jgi:hypothetical protein